ncbi:hypothetical protein CDAR_98941 [Caerostris darwini]|uniref:Uncharacterized protein n=1 Tax=Caerostris darwini TaxID=1538125 RepID=A0AAV4Q272_9ARAC|nr:hypothetical protein CDAR_98941 [Caerostris darwini]
MDVKDRLQGVLPKSGRRLSSSIDLPTWGGWMDPSHHSVAVKRSQCGDYLANVQLHYEESTQEPDMHPIKRDIGLLGTGICIGINDLIPSLPIARIENRGAHWDLKRFDEWTLECVFNIYFWLRGAITEISSLKSVDYTLKNFEIFDGVC